MSLIFPAAAIERPIGLHQAWELLAGNYWRLFACLLLCYLPFGIVHYILGEIGIGNTTTAGRPRSRSAWSTMRSVPRAAWPNPHSIP